ncbi:MliC family protein [Arenimonas sp.]|uniref:MliC family protein n=1 Tax=Arenimonas sp. TaxID=1872635 RepID=UPI0039E30AAB
MKAPVFALVALMLAACQPQPAAPAAEPAAAMPEPVAEAAHDAPPADEVFAASFDCAKATSEIEKLVCADPELAALDKRLADVYQKELDRPDTVKPAMAASQRGWSKGRDDCWKAGDTRRCTLESYWTRLAELQVNSPDTAAPTPVNFDCDNDGQAVSAMFYAQFEPLTMQLQVGKDRAFLFAEPSGSGSKYGRDGAEFWEHQGEASIDFYGNKLKCKPAGNPD